MRVCCFDFYEGIGRSVRACTGACEVNPDITALVDDARNRHSRRPNFTNGISPANRAATLIANESQLLSTVHVEIERANGPTGEARFHNARIKSSSKDGSKCAPYCFKKRLD